MTNALYFEDFFQRIVNVNWNVGTIFIYGTEFGNVLHYVKVSGSGKPVTHVIDLPEPTTVIDYGAQALFGVRGSSYAKAGGMAVFLVCGVASNAHSIVDDVGNPTTAIDFHSLIFASNDGLKWGIVREEAAINNSADSANQNGISATALVWNPDKSSFYFDQLQFGGGAGSVSDQIFSSSTGVGWSMDSSTPTGLDPAYESGFLDQCVNNDCFDSKGQHVPDGVMRYDFKLKTSVEPVSPPTIFYESGQIDYTSPGSSDVIVKLYPPAGRIAAPVDSTIMTMPGIGLVTCAAAYNGAMMAGGYVSSDGTGPGAVALSVDDGRTWKPFAGTSTGVTTMIAAPASDIKSS